MNVRPLLKLILSTSMLSAVVTLSLPAQEAIVDPYTLHSATEAYRHGSYLNAFNRYFRLLDEEQQASWAPLARIQAARAAESLGRYNLAADELEEVVAEYRHTHYVPRALLQRGLTAFTLDQYGEARYLFNEAITHARKHGEAWEDVNTIGEALYWIGVTHAVEPNRSLLGQATASFEACVNEYPSNPRADDALYAMSEVIEGRGDYYTAIKYYERLLENYPASDYATMARIRLAQCLIMTRRYNDALTLLDQQPGITAPPEGQEAGPRPTPVRITDEFNLLRGEAHLGLNQYPAAERAYLGILNTPDSRYHRAAALGIADTYLAAGRPDSAIGLYNRLIQEEGNDRTAMKAQFKRALALREAGQDSAGRAGLRRIGLDSAHLMAGAALIELGRLTYEDGGFEESARLLAKAVTTERNERLRAQGQILLGAALLAANQPDGALKALQAAIELSERLNEEVMPERGDVIALANYLTGLAYLESDSPADAVAALSRFVHDNPNHPKRDEGLYWLGQAYYRTSLYKSVVQTMEELVAEYPSSSRVEEALFSIGWAHFRQQHFENSEAAFARLVKAFPLTRFAADAQLRRGDCRYLMKDYRAAIAEYEQVASTQASLPLLQHSRYQGALARYQLGELPEAQQAFSGFLATYPDAPYAVDALFMTGLIAFRRNQYPEAISVMNRLIEEYDTSRLQARAYYTIGDAYYNLGEYDQAYAAYSIVSNRFQESTYAPDARVGMEYAMAEIQRHEEGAEASTGDEILLKRAAIYMDARRFDEALKEYRTGLAGQLTGENAARAWLGISTTHLRMGDTAASIDTLAYLAQEFPGTEAALKGMEKLSDYYLTLKDTAASIAWCDTIRVHYPGSPEALKAVEREVDFYRAGRRGAEALTLLRETTPLYPPEGNGGSLWLERAAMERLENQIDTARMCLQKLTERQDSIAARALHSLGVLEMSSKDYEAALKAFKDLQRRFEREESWRLRANLGLGETYEGLGNIDKAKEHYRAVLQEGDEPETEGDLQSTARKKLEALEQL